MNLKQTIKSAPILGPILSKLRAPKMVNSGQYWDERYQDGGHSGAGFYGRLAEFKAEVLNDFVEKHSIQSVIEFGVGDGAQLSLAKYPQFVGVDVSPTSVSLCRKRFADHPAYNFCSVEEAVGLTADLSLSLDVVYHLVEDQVFDAYMERLFNASQRWLIIYASNQERIEAEHVRHRKFTRWVQKNRPDFTLSEVVPNRYPYDPADPENTSFADFYVYLRDV